MNEVPLGFDWPSQKVRLGKVIEAHRSLIDYGIQKDQMTPDQLKLMVLYTLGESIF